MAFYENRKIQNRLSLYLDSRSDVVDVAMQGLDLRPFEAQICEYTIQNSYFLGCHLTPRLALHIQAEGSVILLHLRNSPTTRSEGLCITL